MKPLKTFEIGSSVFFSNYSDYHIKDRDYLVIMDSFIPNKTMMKVLIDLDDIFMFKNGLLKQDFINDLIESNVPMKAGKFLISNFCKYINFTIEDLKLLKKYFYSMDDKHKYEKVIYDSYIENNDFTLTDEQKELAYLEYKKYRNNETQETVAS